MQEKRFLLSKTCEYKPMQVVIGKVAKPLQDPICEASQMRNPSHSGALLTLFFQVLYHGFTHRSYSITDL